MYRRFHPANNLLGWSNPYNWRDNGSSALSSYGYSPMTSDPRVYFTFGGLRYGRDGRRPIRRYRFGSHRTPATIRTYEERRREAGREESEDESESDDDNDVTQPTTTAPDVTPAAPAAPPVRVRKPPKNSLKVTNIDIGMVENRRSHEGSDLYPGDIGLVLRRGQTFKITVSLKRKYRADHDRVKVLLSTGNQPLVSNGTQVRLKPEDSALAASDWGCRMEAKDPNTLEFEIMIAADAIVGKYRLFIETSLDSSTEIRRTASNDAIYILFNPWCKDDAVYMESALEREEYVLNSRGRIWQSSRSRSKGKPWNFGQFDQECFEAALYILEISNLPKQSHGNPVLVARAFSAMVNSNSGDNGILSGNWSGNYSGGTSPTKWTGSVAILKQFMKTKGEVKFGQCWVYSGVLTTVCRSVGIPARSVTNFSSAHDTGGNLTIDNYENERGERDDDYDNDSVWNFHVWNDVWMQRPDLPTGDGISYDGWQALDSTPQEVSDGSMQCGPSPLTAIKNGFVNVSYDTKFIFSEVNGDRCKWKVDDNGELTLRGLDTDAVGKNISTKSATGDKREIVTDQYKYEEGSEKGKKAMQNALHQNRSVDRYRTKLIEAYRNMTHVRDVQFDFSLLSESSGNVTYTLVTENKSAETRTVSVYVHMVAIAYTGVIGDELGKRDFNLTLGPHERKEEFWTVKAMDWMNTVAEDANMAADCKCVVKETGQITYPERLQTELDKPDLELTAFPEKINPGENVKIVVKFTNPLNIPLSEIEIQLEGAGIKPQTITVSESLASGETLNKEVMVTPRKVGKTAEVIAALGSRQLTGVDGEVAIYFK